MHLFTQPSMRFIAGYYKSWWFQPIPNIWKSKKPREPWSYEVVGHELKPRLFPPAWWIPRVFPKNPGFFKKHCPEGPEKPLCWNCAISYQKTVTWGLQRSRLWKPHLMEWSIQEIIRSYSLWMPLDMCPMDGRDPRQKLWELRHIVYQQNSGNIVKDGTTFRCKYQNGRGKAIEWVVVAVVPWFAFKSFWLTAH